MDHVAGHDLVYSLLVRLCEDVHHTLPGTESALMDAFNSLAADHSPTRLVSLPELTYDDALVRTRDLLAELAASTGDLSEKLRLLSSRDRLHQVQARRQRDKDTSR